MTNTQFLLELDLPLNPLELLDLHGRFPCPHCAKPAHWACLKCGIPVNMPRVEAPALPRPICALFYQYGNIKKSSAQLLRALDVGNFEFCDFNPQERYDEQTTYLLYPSDGACSVNYIANLQEAKFLVLDSTWAQANKCLQSPALSRLRRVKIAAHRSAFWRPHGKGLESECLSSAECVYWLSCEIERELAARGQLSGPERRFDAILTLYAAYALLVKRELFLRHRKTVAAGRRGELEYEDWLECEQALRKKYTAGILKSSTVNPIGSRLAPAPDSGLASSSDK